MMSPIALYRAGDPARRPHAGARGWDAATRPRFRNVRRPGFRRAAVLRAHYRFLRLFDTSSPLRRYLEEHRSLLHKISPGRMPILRSLVRPRTCKGGPPPKVVHAILDANKAWQPDYSPPEHSYGERLLDTTVERN